VEIYVKRMTGFTLRFQQAFVGGRERVTVPWLHITRRPCRAVALTACRTARVAHGCEDKEPARNIRFFVTT